MTSEQTVALHTPGTRPRGDDGFALVLVIFITAVLALLLLGLAASLRSHIRSTAAAVRMAEAEAMADAGVQLAVLSLIGETRGKPGRFALDGSPSACTAGERATITLSVQDASGLINLNLAGDRLLMALFLGLGASREAASRQTDLIIDYRDPDGDRRPNGAEQAEYEAAGRPRGPKNGPFDTIEEIGKVLGLDPALAAAAMPYLTVHSQTAGLDPRTTPEALSALLAQGARQLPGRANASGLTATGPLPVEFMANSPRRVFLVRSAARFSDGSAFVREAVLEIQPTRTGLPVFKNWHRSLDDPSLPAPATAGPLPPC